MNTKQSIIVLYFTLKITYQKGKSWSFIIYGHLLLSQKREI